MSSLFKPTIISYWAPDGRKCKKRTPGARRKKQWAKKWYGQYVDADGKTRRVPLSTDKAAARALLANLETQVAKGEAGLIDKYAEHRKRPLREHLQDFKQYLASLNNSAKHVELTCSRINAVLNGCRFIHFRDIRSEQLVVWLAAERNTGQMGIQTSNYYLTAFKQFCAWLVDKKRAHENPVVSLKRLNVETDVRLERRHLSDSELTSLVDAAHAGRRVRALDGPDRAILYNVAAHTGLRESELVSLVPESFSLDTDTPTVTVQAAYSKRRREDVLSLRPDLANLLREWIENKPAGEPLWPGGWWRHGGKMIRIDLEAAGIPYRDSAGRVFDFHALRHHFISRLAAAGVHPKVAQELARHSTITLTMDHYTHLELRDLAQALDKLPNVPNPNGKTTESQTLRATGTDPVCTRLAQTQIASRLLVSNDD
jgi:integrase